MALQGFENFRMNDDTKNKLERFLATSTRATRRKNRHHGHAPADLTVVNNNTHTQYLNHRRPRQERRAVA